MNVATLGGCCHPMYEPVVRVWFELKKSMDYSISTMSCHFPRLGTTMGM
jgi:hypothetical protein